MSLFPDTIVTCAHVAFGNGALRVENIDGVRLPGTAEIASTYPGTEDAIAENDPDALDLAIVRMPMPDGVKPLRLDWDGDGSSTAMLIGYPAVPLHFPGRHGPLRKTVEILGRRQKMTRSSRESLILSALTSPGFSGGPMISTSGLVFGVVEQENLVRDGMDREIPYFASGIPILYLLDLPGVRG